MRSELSKIEGLVRQGERKIALPTAWGLLEAITRRLLLNQVRGESKRYNPSTIVEALVSGGYLDDDDGERLREIGRLRNLKISNLLLICILQ